MCIRDRNSIIDPETKSELEKLDFIQRIPKGIYQFRYLVKSEGEEIEKNCEILVYDNIENSYKNFVETLPYFVKDNKLEERESLDEKELILYSKQSEDEFFSGVEKYPAYSINDIKSLLQYYIVQDEVPKYIAVSYTHLDVYKRQQ